MNVLIILAGYFTVKHNFSGLLHIIIVAGFIMLRRSETIQVRIGYFVMKHNFSRLF